MKLQEAYFSEKNKMGGWDMIGYSAPGTSHTGDKGSGYTTNFTYTGAQDKDNSSWEPSDFADGRIAANIGKLNDCAAGTWKIQAKITSGKDSYKGVISGTGCEPLTPNFTAIGH